MDWTTVIDFIKTNSIAVYGAILSTALAIELFISKYRPKVTIGQICYPIRNPTPKGLLPNAYGIDKKEYVYYDLVVVNNSDDMIYVTSFGMMQKIGVFKYKSIYNCNTRLYRLGMGGNYSILPPHDSQNYTVNSSEYFFKKINKPRFLNHITFKGYFISSDGKVYTGKSYRYKFR